MTAKVNTNLMIKNTVSAEQTSVKIFLVLMTDSSQVEHILRRDIMELLQTNNNCFHLERLAWIVKISVIFHVGGLNVSSNNACH